MYNYALHSKRCYCDKKGERRDGILFWAWKSIHVFCFVSRIQLGVRQECGKFHGLLFVCLFVCPFSLFSRFPTDRKRCAHSMLTENQESFFPVIWSLILCMCVSGFPQTELSVVPSFSGGMSRGAAENSI